MADAIKALLSKKKYDVIIKTDGEVSSDFTSNYAVISEELATLNELKVGNTIKLVDTDDSKKTYESNEDNSKTESKKSPKRSERFNFGQSKIEKIDSINAVVNIKVLDELLCIGVLLTLLSSLASMVAISRFSPLTILKERS